LTLKNLIFWKPFQVPGEVDLLTEPDKPLRRVPVEPSDSIAVVDRKLMVEIVISLSPSDKCNEPAVSRRELARKRLVSNPVSEGIDTEGSLLDQEQSDAAGPYKSSGEVIIHEPAEYRREYICRQKE
jgi:hypothetical protein